MHVIADQKSKPFDSFELVGAQLDVFRFHVKIIGKVFVVFEVENELGTFLNFFGEKRIMREQGRLLAFLGPNRIDHKTEGLVACLTNQKVVFLLKYPN